MNKNLLIVGNSSYAVAVKDIADEMQRFDKIDFLGDHSETAVGKVNEKEQFVEGYHFAIAIDSDPGKRLQVTEELEHCGYTIASLQHPQSAVAVAASVAKGSIVEANATVMPGCTIGAAAIISAGSVVAYHAKVGEGCELGYCSVVMPHSVLPRHARLKAGQVYSGTGKRYADLDSDWATQYKQEHGVWPGFF